MSKFSSINYNKGSKGIVMLVWKNNHNHNQSFELDVNLVDKIYLNHLINVAAS